MKKSRLKELLNYVLEPRKGEDVLILTDRLRKSTKDLRQRRRMVGQWKNVLEEIGRENGFGVRLLEYQATYQNNKALPKTGLMGGRRVGLREQFAKAKIYILMNSFSGTKPASDIVRENGNGARFLSMARVTPAMDGAMLADYEKIGRNAETLAKKLENAVGAEVAFSTGHRLYVDLRARPVRIDDGKCRTPGKGINFPSGEVFKVPYENAGDDDLGKSLTEGELPVYDRKTGKTAVLTIKENRIVKMDGPAKRIEKLVRLSRAANGNNMAELGFGLNPDARCGEEVAVIEQEKSKGCHFGFGASIHLGGKVESDIHQDFVYTSMTKIRPAAVYLVYGDNCREKIIENGRYTIGFNA